MAESIVVICPTTQARAPATEWHDGQFMQSWDALVATKRIANVPVAPANAGTHNHRQVLLC
jgi:hypothetical protein